METITKQKTVYNIKYDDILEKYVVVSRKLKTKNPKGTLHHRCYYLTKQTAQKHADKRNHILFKIRTF